MKQTDRYHQMKRPGIEREIKTAFNTPSEMKVFTYAGVLTTHHAHRLDSLQKDVPAHRIHVDGPHDGTCEGLIGGPDFLHSSMTWCRPDAAR